MPEAMCVTFVLSSMASSVSQPSPLSTYLPGKPLLKPSSTRIGFSLIHHQQLGFSSQSFQTSRYLGRRLINFPVFSEITRVSSDGPFDSVEEEEEIFPGFDERPVKFLLWVLFWATVSVGLFAVSRDANAASAAAAAADSIRASSFGVKVATVLRSSGWPDEAVVFALATLPVIELRGAIPVGYWLQLKPALLTVLSILGNMVPVPFIILYLKSFATFLARWNKPAAHFLEMLFKQAKAKAGPVEEFQWIGLLLFVAVPFPGTGAWTGAIIASVLDMPFWPALSANFFGVVFAGLLVNLLVNLGLKYAIVTGIFLFIISTFMWSVLRNLKRSFTSSN